MRSDVAGPLLLKFVIVGFVNFLDVSSFIQSSIQIEATQTTRGPICINSQFRQSCVNNALSVVAASAESLTENVSGVTAIKLNVNEKARTVTSVCTSGTLCTMSSHDGIEGAPFGSHVDYVLDDGGNPVMLMNDMSMHTTNIRDSGEGSFVTLFTQLSGAQGGQDVSRVSLTGTINKIPDDSEDMDAIRMRYSITHSYADQVMDSPKFSFFRMTPAKVYFVGGFGVMAKWVEPEDYRDAEADVLAREASSIIAKLNRDHGEDLLLTANHLLNVENLETIRVTGVDRLGMDLRVTRQIRRNKLQTDEFRVGFRIPVISVEDAKSEILKVFQEAWEKGENIVWDSDDALPGSDVPIVQIAADNLY